MEGYTTPDSDSVKVSQRDLRLEEEVKALTEFN